MGGLMFSALYQRRHADAKVTFFVIDILTQDCVQPSSHKVYVAFAALIFVNVIGVYFSDHLFYGLILVVRQIGSVLAH